MMSPSSILFIFLIPTLMAAIFAFVVEMRRRARWTPILYLIMRSMALIIVFILLHSFFSGEWEMKKTPSPVVMIEDVSASMKYLSKSTAGKLDEMSKELQEKFRKRNGFHFYRFTDKLYENDEKIPDESLFSTALGDAVLEVNKRHPGADVILVTDAASNIGHNPVMGAMMSRIYGTRLHPMLPENILKKDFVDISISEITVSTPNAEDDSREYTALISLENPSKKNFKPIKVEILVDGVKIHSEELAMDAPVKSFSARVQDSENLEPGWHEFEISISALPEERIVANNTARGVFFSYPKDGVTILWDRNSPDLNALREIFSTRYSRFDFFFASRFSDLPEAKQLAIIQHSALLIIGGAPSNSMHKNTLDELEKKLAQGKITLIFITPQNIGSWLAVPHLKQYIPVNGEGLRRNLKSPLLFQYAAKDSEAVSLPLIAVDAFTGDAKNVIMKADDSEKNNVIPLVYSNEHCTLVAFSGSWRWKLSPDRAVARAYAPFWESLLETADQFGNQGFKLTVSEKMDALLPNAYNVILHNYDKTANIENVFLNLLSNNKSESRPLRSMIPHPDGTWRAVIQLNTPGIHWFQAEISAKEKALSNTVPVSLKDNRFEMTRTVDTVNALTHLAKLSDGKLITEKNIMKPESFLNNSKNYIYKRNPAASPFNFIKNTFLASVAILLFALEWLIRKLEMLKHA